MFILSKTMPPQSEATKARKAKERRANSPVKPKTKETVPAKAKTKETSRPDSASADSEDDDESIL